MSTNRIAKIEDHEGHGFCGTCQRDNLRWIVTLADGTQCGTECAKKVLGYTVSPKNYTWMTGYVAVAEYTDACETAVLYRRADGRTVLVSNGCPQVMGGGAREFERRYGAVAA